MSSDSDPYDVPYGAWYHGFVHPKNLFPLVEEMTAGGVNPIVPARRGLRVLDIGCGEGADIVHIASTMEDVACVGIDTSGHQIGRAIALSEEAVLMKNSQVNFIVGEVHDTLDAEHEAVALSRLALDLGHFDLILCMGVFSWILPHEQGRVIREIRNLLRESGVAVVGQSMKPAALLNQAVYETLRFGMLGMHDDAPDRRVARGIEYIEAVAKNSNDQAWSTLLYREADRLRKAGSGVAYHEIYSEEMNPMLFTDFWYLAQSCGLRYLGDAKTREYSKGLKYEAASDFMGRASRCSILALA